MKKAIINWMYFLFNHKYDWIDECFPENDHVKEKYNYFCKLHDSNSTKGMLYFFMELDRTHQNIMTEYVNNNYIAFEDLKTSEGDLKDALMYIEMIEDGNDLYKNLDKAKKSINKFLS